MNRIVLIDDQDLDVLAVVETKHTHEEALDIIKEVKENNPGEWSTTDIIEALEGVEIECKHIYI